MSDGLAGLEGLLAAAATAAAVVGSGGWGVGGVYRQVGMWVSRTY